MTEPAQHVPLDQIKQVTIPTIVACEVEGCSWLIPNEQGSFQEYTHHLRQHSDEELQPLREVAERFFQAGNPAQSDGSDD